jgi:hypothetical protein
VVASEPVMDEQFSRVNKPSAKSPTKFPTKEGKSKRADRSLMAQERDQQKTLHKAD